MRDEREWITLPTWAKRSKFRYTGSIEMGTKIAYGNGYRWRASVSAAQYAELLKHFGNKIVSMGTSRDAAPRGSVGEWLQANVTRTAIASYVGPILIDQERAHRVDEHPSLIQFRWVGRTIDAHVRRAPI